MANKLSTGQRRWSRWTAARFLAIVRAGLGRGAALDDRSGSGAALDKGTGLLEQGGGNSFFTRLLTWWRGEWVGQDEHGNRYYRERGDAGSWRRERRWVVFAGAAEPTLVPPGWVGWLHRRIERPPSVQPLPAPRWERERLPNLTGTDAAYLPPGALQRGGQRAPATGDYEAWRPD